jgi:hypothetical protein
MILNRFLHLRRSGPDTLEPNILAKIADVSYRSIPYRLCSCTPRSTRDGMREIQLHGTALLTQVNYDSCMQRPWTHTGGLRTRTQTALLHTSDIRQPGDLTAAAGNMLEPATVESFARKRTERWEGKVLMVRPWFPVHPRMNTCMHATTSVARTALKHGIHRQESSKTNVYLIAQRRGFSISKVVPPYTAGACSAATLLQAVFRGHLHRVFGW